MGPTKKYEFPKKQETHTFSGHTLCKNSLVSLKKGCVPKKGTHILLGKIRAPGKSMGSKEKEELILFRAIHGAKKSLGSPQKKV